MTRRGANKAVNHSKRVVVLKNTVWSVWARAGLSALAGRCAVKQFTRR